jgi:RND superfamily putative drug exporter
MIGLGVGVDYALFIVTRFRENHRTNGGDVPLAVEAAINTSGRAVLFAGATVVIALLGMFALGVSLLNGAAVAAAIGVIMVLAASLTLLPALLSLVGRRVARPGRGQAAEADPGTGFWLRWVQRIQRRPAVTAIAATALMLVLAAPALGLRLASSDAGNDPTSQTTRQAYDLLANGFGPGFNGPLQLAVALPRANDSAVLTQLTHAVSSMPGIESVAAPRLNAGGTAASVLAYPTTSPQSAQTSSLVDRLRNDVIPLAEHGTATRVYVGGSTASQVDFSHVLSAKLPLFIGIVIALAALLLVMVFRSLVIPVQAAVMNLLSIVASLGVIEAVFERGWLSRLFGTQAGPIDAFIPVLAFAIVFGLSMDYEVFLISRVHEEWQRDGNASRAVREGLSRTGRGQRGVPRRARRQDAPAARRPAVARANHLGPASLARPTAAQRRDRGGRAADEAPAAAGACIRVGLMTNERTLDRLIAHLRGQVAELWRLERNGAAPEEVADRKRLILRLQERLAHAVRGLLDSGRTSPV